MTGNVLLTFTDVALPGNAGFELRIQRTYNSKIYDIYQSTGGPALGEDSWAGLGWTLHFGRVINPNPSPSDPGPIIEMPDGSRHQLFRHLDGLSGHYISRDYWTYDNGGSRPPVLRLPNGVTYTFGRRVDVTAAKTFLYVTTIEDSFGNRILIKYAPLPAPFDAIESLEQHLGSGQTRTVSFTFAATLPGANGNPVAAGSLRSMTFLARTWSYTQKRMPNLGYTLLTKVTPPIGPSWSFAYNESTASNQSPWELIRVTTPSGGQIDYTYAAQAFLLGSAVIYTPTLKTRTTSGPGIVGGIWLYSYSSPSGTEPVHSGVTSPCGTKTSYTFRTIGPYGREEPWGIGVMASKVVADTADQVLERQELTWAASAPISNFPESGNSPETHVPLLQIRATTRSGNAQAYRFTFSYDAAPYNRARASNFNDYGRPISIREDGTVVRVSARSFFYGTSADPSFSNYIVDKVASETLAVGGESFARSYAYDPATGFRTSQTVYGITTTFAPDPRGNVRSSTDANGNTTRFQYDWGVNSDVRTPEYRITRNINPEGTIASETRRGFTSLFGYDQLSRIVRATPPVGNPVVTQYDNVNGRFTRVTRGPSMTETDVNGFGERAGTIDSVGTKTEMEYDACGRPTYESYPFRGVSLGTTTSYDALGRTTRRINPDGTPATFDYSGIDVTVTDENRRSTRFDFSAFGDPDEGRLVAVTDAAGNTTRYAYNALGSLRRVESPRSAAIRTWLYNGRNQVIREDHPENGSITYTYDAVGNTRTRQDLEFGLTRFDYDRNNRLVRVDRPGTAGDTTIGYDDSDNRTVLANARVQSRFEYDGANRLTSRIDALAAQRFTTSYRYDGNANITRIDYPSGRGVTQAFDSENRITLVQDTEGGVYARNFSYHPSGAIISFQAGNGLTQTFDYDERYRLRNLNSGGILRLGYGYDGVGNVRTIADARPGMSQGFDYDLLDRLTYATGPGGVSRFSYDDIGNRLSKVFGGALSSYRYDPASNRLADVAGAESGRFDYDRNGNLKRDPVASYTYTPENQIESVTAAARVTTYEYDGDNLRKLKTEAGVTHFYLHGPGDQILSELRNGGNGLEPVRDYVYAGSRLLAQVRAAALVVKPRSLSFAGLTRGAPAPAKTFTVDTPGASGVAWRAFESSPWLRLSARGGVAPATVSVSADPARLKPGTYVGTITVSAPGTTGGPIDINVTFTVAAEPELQVTPSSLSFSAVVPNGSQAASGASIPDGRGWALRTTPSTSRVAEAYGRVPVAFERNEGQTDSVVRYLSRGRGYALFMTPEEVVIGLVRLEVRGGRRETKTRAADATLRMKFLGANPSPVLEGLDPMASRSRYYRGPDPERWSAALPHYAKVAYRKLYPDVDLTLYGNQRELEYDLLLAPGADLASVRLSFEGAREIRVDEDGNLVLALAEGEVRQLKPIVYQEDGGVRRCLPGRFVLRSPSEVGFEVTGYDPTLALVVDPVISYATFLGGTDALENGGSTEAATAIAIDAFGGAYLTGFTKSLDFPVRSAEQANKAGGFDAFVAKLDPAGRSLVYSTFLGGARNDFGVDIAVDSGGNAYVAGETHSPDFPVTPLAFQTTFTGGACFGLPELCPNTFVTKLDPAGAIVYSSFLGGSEADNFPTAIGVDPAGNAYVAGYTPNISGGFPLKNPFQSDYHTSFLTKISADGSSLLFSTYFGGSVVDWINAIAVDSSGHAYLTGFTLSPDFPLAAPFQGTTHSQTYPWNTEAFLSKFSPDGSALVYSTYLGGSGDDDGLGVAIDGSGSAYVVGGTRSPDFPTRFPLQPEIARDANDLPPLDCFVAKFDPAGSRLVYSTYLGGNGGDACLAIGLDAGGSAYVTGGTGSADFPVVGATRPTHDFLAKLDARGSALLYSTGISGASAYDIAVDGAGNAYVLGGAAANDPNVANFATPGAFQTSIKGVGDSYVAKVVSTGSEASAIASLPLLVKDRTLETGPVWSATVDAPWLTLSDSSGAGPSVILATADATALAPGNYSATITVAAPTKSSPQRVPVNLTVASRPLSQATADPGGPYQGVTNAPVAFDGRRSLDPAGSIASYAWDFGDGSKGSGPTPRHTYTTSGVHTVRLTITGYSGAAASASTIATINQPPVVSAGPNLVVTLPTVTVTLRGTASDDGIPAGAPLIVRWIKSSGPGSAVFSNPDQAITNASFDRPGVYGLCLTASDSELTSVSCASVTVNEPPIADVGGPYVTAPARPLSFDGSASRDPDGTVVSYDWDFGDGATGTGPRPEHSYATAGTFRVTLTVTDNVGATASATTSVTVGTLLVTPARLRFSMFSGGEAPAAQKLSLSAPGGADLAWTAAASVPWIRLSSTTGSTPFDLVVSINPAGIADGAQKGSITVIPDAAVGEPQKIPVELVVEPAPGKACATDAWYCENFDELSPGDLGGQRGWQADPTATATGRVVSDPRRADSGNALLLDPVSGNFTRDEIAFSDLRVEGSEVSFQVATADASDPAPIGAFELLGRVGQGWGSTGRVLVAFQFGSRLSLRYGPAPEQEKALVDVMESGRWYTVTLRFENGQIAAFVDGALAFSAPSPAASGVVVQGMGLVASDLPGTSHVDLLQVRALAAASLLVEPARLDFSSPENGQCAQSPAESALGAAPAGFPSAQKSSPSESRDGRAEAYGRLPLSFEANLGQTDPRVIFLSRGRGYGVFLTSDGAVLELQKRAEGDRSLGTQATRRDVIGLKLRAANPSPKLVAQEELKTRSHYLLGRDPRRWRTGIPHYARVDYQGVYPGTDLVFHGSEGHLEYDFVLAPGADPGRIALEVEGAKSMRMGPEGSLVIETNGEPLRMEKPRVYQSGRKVEGRYRLEGDGRVRFEVAAYDREKPLLIDPVLVYSTYLGGTAVDAGYGIAVDGEGNAYIAGGTVSADFPTTTGVVQQSLPGAGSAFVAKLDPSGTSLLYATYLGGSAADFAYAVAVTPEGAAYVAGHATSSDFPTVNAAQSTLAGGEDGFLARLSPDGSSLVFSTYLGGSSSDFVSGLALDTAGAAYVVGPTFSADFPVKGSSPADPPFQDVAHGLHDGFVSKFDASGTLVYSTYLGGGKQDIALAVAVDASGSAYVTGSTKSGDFPVVHPIQVYDTNGARPEAGFVAKLNPEGSALVYSTWLNPAFAEGIGRAIAVDSSGNAYVAGSTESIYYPTTPGAVQPTFQGYPSDGFVTKIDPDGRRFVYSTFLGGSGADAILGVAVDAARSAHLVGVTGSPDFPVPGCLRTYRAGADAFVTKLAPNGSVATYSTLLGGKDAEWGTAIALDGAGNVYVTGYTASPDFPLGTDPFQTSLRGQTNGFVAKLSPAEVEIPGSVRFDPNRYDVAESQGSVALTVSRVCGSLGPVSVDFATNAGSAQPGTNYLDVAGTLDFPDGDTLPKTIHIPILQDGQIQCAGLDFTVSLGNVSAGAALGVDRASVHIQDSDEGRRQFTKNLVIRDLSQTTGPAWQAVTDAPWLSLSSYVGVGPSTVRVTVDITGLSAGTYRGTVTITAAATNSPQVITVTLTILRTGGGE